MPDFCALHISDLHFSINDHDQSKVINAFFKDLTLAHKLVGRRPDIIVFSGDLVKAGDDAGAFQAAKAKFIDPLIAHLSLNDSRFFLVPGNHDVQKSRVRERDEVGLEHSITTGEDINRIIDNYDTDFVDLKGRLENYRAFHSEYSFGGFPILKSSVFSTHEVVVDNRKIGVACLNSAIRATGAPEQRDYGKMMMGTKQIELAAGSLKACALKIAVFHHSPDWLSLIEQTDIKRLLRGHFDIWLFGHSHTTYAEYARNAESRVLISNAGALYERSQRYIGYSLVSSDAHALAVRVRSYFRERDGFDSGINVLPKGRLSVRRAGGRRRAPQDLIAQSHADEEVNNLARARAALRPLGTDQLVRLFSDQERSTHAGKRSDASALVSVLLSRQPDIFKGHRFTDVDLRHCDFTGADLTGAVFLNCDLSYAYFADVILDNAVMDGADLERTAFVEVASFRSVEISPSKGLLCAGSGGFVVEWESKRVLLGHQSTILDVAISCCGKFVAASDEEGMVIIWESGGTGEPLRSPLRKYQTPVYALCWHPFDNRQLASSGRHGSILLWDWKLGPPAKEHFNHSGEVLSLDWNPNGRCLLSAGTDGRIVIWDTQRWVSSVAAENHGDYVRCVKWRNNEVFASAGDDGAVIIWKWDGNRAVPMDRMKFDVPVLSLAWHPKENLLACGLRDDSVLFWKSWDSSRTRRRDLKRLKLHIGRVWDLVWSGDGRRVISVGNDGSVIEWNNVYDGERHKLRKKAEILHDAREMRMRFSCNGLRLRNIRNSSAGGYLIHKNKDRDWEVEEASLIDWLRSKGAIVMNS